MKSTLIAAALTLGAIATAHADTPIQYGETHGLDNGSVTQSQTSTLTREAVIAELKAAQANGTMPRYGEAQDFATTTAPAASAVTRAEVQSEAYAATQASFHAQPTASN